MHSVDSEGGASGWGGGCGVTLGILPSTKRIWSLSTGDDVWAPWWSHRAILFSVDVLLCTGIVSGLGDCPGSVVYSLLLDHIPFPKANPPLSPEEAGPFLTRFVFSSLEGPLSPNHDIHSTVSYGLDVAWFLKPPNALSATLPGHRRTSCPLPNFFIYIKNVICNETN